MQYFHTIFNTSLIDMIYDQTWEFFTKSGKTTLMWKIYPLLIKITFQINLHTILKSSLIYIHMIKQGSSSQRGGELHSCGRLQHLPMHQKRWRLHQKVKLVVIFFGKKVKHFIVHQEWWRLHNKVNCFKNLKE